MSVDGGDVVNASRVSSASSGLTDVTCIDAKHCLGLLAVNNTDNVGLTPYISDNGGRSWAATGSSQIGVSVSCAERFCIRSCTYHPVGEPGTDTDTAFVSTDGGRSWTEQSLPRPLLSRAWHVPRQTTASRWA